MAEVSLTFDLVAVVMLPCLDYPLDHLLILALETCLMVVLDVGYALRSWCAQIVVPGMRTGINLALSGEQVHEVATMCFCFFDDVHPGVVITKVP